MFVGSDDRGVDEEDRAGVGSVEKGVLCTGDLMRLALEGERRRR